ncbi:uncharacterized protein B0I36DRAFT_435236 [Microdochium trichocladiopsis]|uniref:1-alkyl-2-acetylglycerophosphocholine esterase n=1 Tax=Microdochium trichocladiopsis TaxID=1682393 RepID=A0A9P8XZJ1_9PEZI|nr:uncharacterized protein B0I36DRAFT_435236 [Microdochium trichocladiopsis]KAH7021414.1 hypothetical protein B0I36DRAFT_435236 [Microdochium trichocladiopsis]
MRSPTTTALVLAAALAVPAAASPTNLPRQGAKIPDLALPDTTGPYKVGTTAFPLTDYARIDPLADPPAPRRVMISIFYPTDLGGSGQHNYTYAPIFPPQTASIFDGIIPGAPPGTAAMLRTRSFLGAPILPRPQKKDEDPFPALFFSHGFGGIRLFYTARMQELASRGWVVVNIDHPFDAQVVEFPPPAGAPEGTPGELVFPYANDTVGYTPIGGVEGLQKMRAADMRFVRAQLRSNETVRAQVPGLVGATAPNLPCGPHGHGGSVGNNNNNNNKVEDGLQAAKVGAFGHSLGGASSAQAVSSYHGQQDGFVCGINIDGTIWGSLPQDGLAPPSAPPADLSFMLFSNANVTRSQAQSWAQFWDTNAAQKQVKLQRQFGVREAVHNSFTDAGLYFQLLGAPVPPEYGTIDPKRLLQVEAAYVDAFFGTCLKKKGVQRLDELHVREFPETFVGE